MSTQTRWLAWLARLFRAADYAIVLPLISRLPLATGYAIAVLRGRVNGWLGRDWRSAALRSPQHIARQSAAGFRILSPTIDHDGLHAWVRARFATESREEFEGQLLAARRATELHRSIEPDGFLRACLQRERGLVLLTPHFDSFTLGIVFLGLAGVKINAMSSAITNDPRVTPSVRQHFARKYRGMETYMNGGRILDFEDGLRPFYRMLERKECLVVLADAPAAEGGASVTPFFIGARRRVAGGGVGLARRTASELGAFVCRFMGPGRYALRGGMFGDAENSQAVDAAYRFLSDAIAESPGLWWAADLLPAMNAVASDAPEGVAQG